MADTQVEARFAVCVANEGSDDLSVGMLYRVLPDEAAAVENLLRVIDDSGEDYLYPSTRFVLIEVPEAEIPKLLIASATQAA